MIIKGTSVWRGTGGGYQEIDTGTLLQMMGRAGRPGKIILRLIVYQIDRPINSLVLNFTQRCSSKRDSTGKGLNKILIKAFPFFNYDRF